MKKAEKGSSAKESKPALYDIIIVGAGPAGLSAGLFAARRNLKTLILGELVGGQMLMAHEVENYPGVEKISGPELAKIMEVQARKFGCEFKMEKAVAMDFRDWKKIVQTDSGKYEGKSVILATGSEHRVLGIAGEKEFLGRGVSYCAACDAPFFKGKTVAIVGGSDAAISYALLLKQYTDDVSLIHRRDELRAETANQKKLQEKNVKIIWNTLVKEIKGKDAVEKLILENVKTNKTSEMPIDGVFISAGNVPTTTLAKNAGVTLDTMGYVASDKEQKTNVPGVFAAGDICGGILQIAQAVGQGAIAATAAYKHAQNLK